jgi:hypothetical protein
MNTVTFDFDVVTDAPAPKRRPPEAADQAPQADAEREPRRRTQAPPQELRPGVQAAE